MIYAMFLILVMLLYFVFNANKKDLLAPGFIFTLSFTLSCAWAVMYARTWGMMRMNPITVFAIVGAVV